MINSPCTKQCKLNENDICTGCYRDKEEIMIWNKSSDLTKKIILWMCELRESKYK